jgi:hypothetical protein
MAITETGQSAIRFFFEFTVFMLSATIRLR